MKTRIILISLAFMTLNAVVGCTFRSNQLNALLSLLPSKSQGPVATWYLSSTKIYEEVYPINVEDEVWFANEEGLFVRFDGWNITEVKNISVNFGDMVIKNSPSGKAYISESAVPLMASCNEWSKASSASVEMTIYEEPCVFDGQDYTNRIAVDSLGSIVELRYRFHPEYDYFFLKPF